MINHGRCILKEMAAKSLKGQIKQFGMKWGVRLYQFTAVSVAFIAGLCSADVLVQFIH